MQRQIHWLWRRHCCWLIGVCFFGCWAGRFRGPNGTGIVADGEPLPLTWSNDRGIRWKIPVPRGASSPIVVGDLVVVTGYSGYGEKLDEPGDRADLRLHVLALSRLDGGLRWQLTLEPAAAEQEATPRIADHGYASPTPCSDGEQIYAAFGPSGVVCCDLEGRERWRTSIGSGVAGFGAAASPIEHGPLVYINAAIESKSLVALDKKTGEIVWRNDDVTRAWTTPVIVETASGSTELVMHHKDVIRGYDPGSGAVLWTCQGIPDYVVPGIVVVGETLYCSGGRQITGRMTRAWPSVSRLPTGKRSFASGTRSATGSMPHWLPVTANSTPSFVTAPASCWQRSLSMRCLPRTNWGATTSFSAARRRWRVAESSCDRLRPSIALVASDVGRELVSATDHG